MYYTIHNHGQFYQSPGVSKQKNLLKQAGNINVQFRWWHPNFFSFDLQFLEAFSKGLSSATTISQGTCLFLGEYAKS